MKNLKIPIGIRLNTIITIILALSFISILYFATKIFKEDNRNNINSLNASIAQANAWKVKWALTDTINMLTSMAKILQSKAANNKLIAHYLQDSSFISLSIFQETANKSKLTLFKANPNAIKSYNIKLINHKKMIKNLLTKFQVSFLGEIKIRSEILNNSLPVLFLSIPFIQKENGEFSSILIGAINQSKILNMFKDKSLFISYLLDDKGTVIAHPDHQKIIEKVNYSTIPLVKSMLEGKVNTGQQEFIDDNGIHQLGAFSLSGISGIGVISQVEKNKAYEATQLLIKKSAKLSLIVLITSIIFVYLFSYTISSPIRLLVAMTHKISKGIYDIKIKKKSRDEIGDLATAFEEMAIGLQQRERLKSTFGKFVNKELAEQALKGELTLGGERKNVTVFFSDIRNFTAMSEQMEPEEVLSMLNEYMSKMVDIITSRNGVVDKFVGDAIMAIWGAPITRKDDTQNALIACLEMRQALHEFNKKRKLNGKNELRIGMGLNTGHVIAGNMGSSEKMEYTVIGDNVNLASRIESQTKEMETDFLINKSVYDELKDIVVVSACKKVYVKGKTEGIQLYKVIGLKDQFGVVQEYTKDPYLIEKPDRDKNSSQNEDLKEIKEWYIAANNKKLGPFSENEVKKLFSEDETLYKSSKIYKEGYKDWEAPWFHSPFERRNFKNSLQVISDKDAQKKIWFIAQKNIPYGPFTFAEIKALLEKQTISLNDAVWRNGWDSWKALHQISMLNRRK